MEQAKDTIERGKDLGSMHLNKEDAVVCTCTDWRLLIKAYETDNNNGSLIPAHQRCLMLRSQNFVALYVFLVRYYSHLWLFFPVV